MKKVTKEYEKDKKDESIWIPTYHVSPLWRVDIPKLALTHDYVTITCGAHTK